MVCLSFDCLERDASTGDFFEDAVSGRVPGLPRGAGYVTGIVLLGDGGISI